MEVSNNTVYSTGVLQMYEKESSQLLSLQRSSLQIDTQSSTPLLLSGSRGCQFTKPSALLSDVQMKVPSTARSFPPTQYVQQSHQTLEHKANKEM